jgi:hypothetical protein
MHSSQSSTDFSITREFLPHILFRGFLLPTQYQNKTQHITGTRIIYDKKAPDSGGFAP